MSKVAHDVALQEFERLYEAYDLDFQDDNAGMLSLKEAIVAAIEAGKVTVDEHGLPTVSLKYPVGEISAVTFKLITAEMLMASGDKKSANTITQDWKTLADMTGQPFTLFQKMRVKPDFQLMQKFILLFLV